MAQRPSHQRWIKRPPRPSRPVARRTETAERPGGTQFVMSLGFGLACGIIGAVLGPELVERPGMGGLFGGLGFALGFAVLWRGLGGTRQDLRRIFRS
jgi:hypothetical protein